MADGGLRKLLRFTRIYGPGRALFKAAGRLRLTPPVLRPRLGPRDIGLIGCGQFAFATIGYFLQRRFGRRLLVCHDIEERQARSLARALKVPQVAPDVDALLATPGLRTVYVASNHATHAEYAARALARGLDAYVEKPVAVSLAQLAVLERARRAGPGRLFAGYNRPFAAALRDLRERLQVDPQGGISMQCFVAGHQLGADHWYRRPQEGTRICGNVGHWLDLFVHVAAWRGLPDRLQIALSWADPGERDDNMNIAITSDRADLCSIVLSARNEPFEGIHESIQIQHAQALCQIDDFRQMVLRQGKQRFSRRYWPKDPGHRRAIMQPFDAEPRRDWAEVEASTLLMLHIADMVRAGESASDFTFTQARAKLALALETA